MALKVTDALLNSIFQKYVYKHLMKEIKTIDELSHYMGKHWHFVELVNQV